MSGTCSYRQLTIPAWQSVSMAYLPTKASRRHDCEECHDTRDTPGITVKGGACAQGVLTSRYGCPCLIPAWPGPQCLGAQHKARSREVGGRGAAPPPASPCPIMLANLACILASSATDSSCSNTPTAHWTPQHTPCPVLCCEPACTVTQHTLLAEAPSDTA